MISVSLDTRAVQRMLTDVQKRQLPFARMTALNDVGFQIQRAERAAMSEVFKHPRPFTQRSVMVAKATKTLPAVTIFVRPEAAKYLQPYETGGEHVVPGKMLLDPVDMRLDRYGQLTRTQVATLNAMANDPKSQVKIMTIHGIRGYWMRTGSATVTRSGAWRFRGLRLLAKIEEPGPVNKHLGFVERAAALAAKTIDPAFHRAMEAAIATSRP